eukprot:684437-Hanusia_phi.AAC.2
MDLDGASWHMLLRNNLTRNIPHVNPSSSSFTLSMYIRWSAAPPPPPSFPSFGEQGRPGTRPLLPVACTAASGSPPARTTGPGSARSPRSRPRTSDCLVGCSSSPAQAVCPERPEDLAELVLEVGSVSPQQLEGEGEELHCWHLPPVSRRMHPVERVALLVGQVLPQTHDEVGEHDVPALGAAGVRLAPVRLLAGMHLTESSFRSVFLLNAQRPPIARRVAKLA